MHGLVVLDEAGDVIRPAILWNDQRTAAECAEIEERIGLERLIQLTGNRALTGFTAPKLLWLRRHEPEAFARIAHVLLPKDYVRFRRTGEHAIDVADASGTLLFDVANRRWSDEVLAALELPREWLPPAYESTEIARRRRPGRGGARCRHRRTRPALGRPRHLGCRLRGARRVPAGARGAAAHLLPRRSRDVARDGRDALGGRLAAVAAERARQAVLRRVARGGGDLAAGHRGPALPALPPGRADAARRPRCARRVRRPAASTRPRRTCPGGAGRRRLRAARLAGAAAQRRRPVRGRPGLRRRRPQRALAQDRRLRPRPPARAHRGRGRRRLRSGAARRGRRGRLQGRPRRGRGDRAHPRPRRSGPRLAGGVRGRLRPLPAALSRAAAADSSRRRAGSGARGRCSRSRRRSRSRARPCRPRCRAFAGS